MQEFMFWRFGFVLFYLTTSATFSYCLGQGVAKLEDSLPQELRNLSDVALIVQKLRFLRSNDSYFGEKHPNKKSTQAQISEFESALRTIIELNNMPSRQSAVTESSMNIEDSLPQVLRNRPDVEQIIQKLRFSRMNRKLRDTTYFQGGDCDPKLK